MAWIPFVSFWQVTADMVFAVNVPDGHGHKYEADYVNGWAASPSRRAGAPPTPITCARGRSAVAGG